MNNKITFFYEKFKESHLLMIKSIEPDLKSFELYQGVLLFLFGLVSIIFSIIDFNYFNDRSLNILFWINDKNAGIEYWRRVLMTLSGVASFTGVLCVVLTTKGKISSYFWGIINCILYGIFAFAYGYAGDAQLNIVFFLPMQFVGIYMWNNNLDDTSTVKSISLNWYQWLLVLLCAFGFGVGFYYEIPKFAEALTGVYYFQGIETPRILDSTTNALSIIAQILSIKRCWQQWIFWIVIDCIQITMFAGVAGYGIQFNIVVMWSLFLINALFGFYLWFKRWLESNNKKNTDNSRDITVVELNLQQRIW